MTAPINDDIAKAIQIGPLDGSLTGTVAGATMGLNDPVGTPNLSGMDFFGSYPQTVWYEYVNTRRVVVDVQVTDVDDSNSVVGFHWGIFTLYPNELDGAYLAYPWGGQGDSFNDGTFTGFLYNPGTRYVIGVGGNPAVWGKSEFNLSWTIVEYWDGNQGSTNTTLGNSDRRVTRSNTAPARISSTSALTPEIVTAPVFQGVNLENLIGKPPSMTQPCQVFLCSELAAENNFYERQFLMGWTEQNGAFFYSFVDSTPDVFQEFNSGSEGYGPNDLLVAFSLTNMIGGSPKGVPVLRSRPFFGVPLPGSQDYYANPSYDSSRTIGTGVDPNGLLLSNPNLYQGDNSSFEGSLGGWVAIQAQSGSSGWSIKQVTPGYSSSGAMKIHRGIGEGYARGPLIPHVFGNKYRASAWLQAPGGTVSIELLDTHGNVISRAGVGVSFGSGWEFVESIQFNTNYDPGQQLETGVAYVCVAIWGNADCIADDVCLTYNDHQGARNGYHVIDKANHVLVNSGDMPTMSCDMPTGSDPQILQTHYSPLGFDPNVLGPAVPSVQATTSTTRGKPYALAVAYSQNTTIKWPAGTTVLRGGTVNASLTDAGAVWALAALTPGQNSYEITALGGLDNILRVQDSTNFGPTVGGFTTGIWTATDPGAGVFVGADAFGSGVNSLHYAAVSNSTPTTNLEMLTGYHQSGGTATTNGAHVVEGETFTVSAWMRAVNYSYIVTMSAVSSPAAFVVGGTIIGSQTLAIDGSWSHFSFTATTDGNPYLGLQFAITTSTIARGVYQFDASVTDVRVSGGPPLEVTFVRMDDDDEIILDAWDTGVVPTGDINFTVPDISLPTQNAYVAIGMWAALVAPPLGSSALLSTGCFAYLARTQAFANEALTGFIGAAGVDPAVRRLSGVAAVPANPGASTIAPTVGAVLLFRGKPNQKMPNYAANDGVTWLWNPHTSSMFGGPVPISPYSTLVYPLDQDHFAPQGFIETPASFGVMETDQDLNWIATHFVPPRNVNTDRGITLSTAHDLVGNLFYVNYEGGKSITSGSPEFTAPTRITVGRYDPVKRSDLGELFEIGAPFQLGLYAPVAVLGQTNDGSVLATYNTTELTQTTQLVVRYSAGGEVLFVWDLFALFPDLIRVNFQAGTDVVGIDYGGDHFWLLGTKYRDVNQRQQVGVCYRIGVEDTTVGDPTIVINYPYPSGPDIFYNRFVNAIATGPGYFNPGAAYPGFQPNGTTDVLGLGNADQRTHRS